ncbi:hypothetical protein ACKVMY_20835 [Vibrio natriegens]|uniref:hypothetical protein n=1 Tax=Vibrio natriegens TaxID=691 RepID=UPI003DA167E0
MYRTLPLLISLLLSTYSNANDFEAKLPCLAHDKDVFIGWMTKQECIEKQGVTPDMLGEKSESGSKSETLASTTTPNKK